MNPPTVPSQKQGYKQYHTLSYRSSARDRPTSRKNRSDGVGCRGFLFFCPRLGASANTPPSSQPLFCTVLPTLDECTSIYQITKTGILYSQSRRSKTIRRETHTQKRKEYTLIRKGEKKNENIKKKSKKKMRNLRKIEKNTKNRKKNEKQNIKKTNEIETKIRGEQKSTWRTRTNTSLTLSLGVPSVFGGGRQVRSFASWL